MAPRLLRLFACFLGPDPNPRHRAITGDESGGAQDCAPNKTYAHAVEAHNGGNHEDGICTVVNAGEPTVAMVDAGHDSNRSWRGPAEGAHAHGTVLDVVTPDGRILLWSSRGDQTCMTLTLALEACGRSPDLRAIGQSAQQNGQAGTAGTIDHLQLLLGIEYDARKVVETALNAGVWVGAIHVGVPAHIAAALLAESTPTAAEESGMYDIQSHSSQLPVDPLALNSANLSGAARYSRPQSWKNSQGLLDMPAQLLNGTGQAPRSPVTSPAGQRATPSRQNLHHPPSPLQRAARRGPPPPTALPASAPPAPDDAAAGQQGAIAASGVRTETAQPWVPAADQPAAAAVPAVSLADTSRPSTYTAGNILAEPSFCGGIGRPHSGLDGQGLLALPATGPGPSQLSEGTRMSLLLAGFEGLSQQMGAGPQPADLARRPPVGAPRTARARRASAVADAFVMARQAELNALAAYASEGDGGFSTHGLRRTGTGIPQYPAARRPSALPALAVDAPGTGGWVSSAGVACKLLQHAGPLARALNGVLSPTGGPAAGGVPALGGTQQAVGRTRRASVASPIPWTELGGAPERLDPAGSFHSSRLRWGISGGVTVSTSDKVESQALQQPTAEAVAPPGSSAHTARSLAIVQPTDSEPQPQPSGQEQEHQKERLADRRVRAASNPQQDMQLRAALLDQGSDGLTDSRSQHTFSSIGNVLNSARIESEDLGSGSEVPATATGGGRSLTATQGNIDIKNFSKSFTAKLSSRPRTSFLLQSVMTDREAQKSDWTNSQSRERSRSASKPPSLEVYKTSTSAEHRGSSPTGRGGRLRSKSMRMLTGGVTGAAAQLQDLEMAAAGSSQLMRSLQSSMRRKSALACSSPALIDPEQPDMQDMQRDVLRVSDPAVTLLAHGEDRHLPQPASSPETAGSEIRIQAQGLTHLATDADDVLRALSSTGNRPPNLSTSAAASIPVAAAGAPRLDAQQAALTQVPPSVAPSGLTLNDRLARFRMSMAADGAASGGGPAPSGRLASGLEAAADATASTAGSTCTPEAVQLSSLITSVESNLFPSLMLGMGAGASNTSATIGCITASSRLSTGLPISPTSGTRHQLNEQGGALLRLTGSQIPSPMGLPTAATAESHGVEGGVQRRSAATAPHAALSQDEQPDLGLGLVGTVDRAHTGKHAGRGSKDGTRRRTTNSAAQAMSTRSNPQLYLSGTASRTNSTSQLLGTLQMGSVGQLLLSTSQMVLLRQGNAMQSIMGKTGPAGPRAGVSKRVGGAATTRTPHLLQQYQAASASHASELSYGSKPGTGSDGRLSTLFPISDMHDGHMAAADSADIVLQVTVRPVANNNTKERALLVSVSDISARAAAEELLLQLTESQLGMMSEMFPVHIIQFLAQREAAAQHARDTRPADIGHMARTHKDVTLLFMDIVGFTSMSKEVKASRVMAFLNELFSIFDNLVLVHGVHKVETAGDCYIVSCGVVGVGDDGFLHVLESHDAADSAARVMAFAKDMLAAAATVTMPHNGHPTTIRIGIHTGDCTSGLIGSRLPKFSIFGDSMNTASRMESTCVPLRIQVSETTHALLRHEPWEATGGVEVKGKGLMSTYLWAGSTGNQGQGSSQPPIVPPSAAAEMLPRLSGGLVGPSPFPSHTPPMSPELPRPSASSTHSGGHMQHGHVGSMPRSSVTKHAWGNSVLAALAATSILPRAAAPNTSMHQLMGTWQNLLPPDSPPASLLGTLHEVQGGASSPQNQLQANASWLGAQGHQGVSPDGLTNNIMTSASNTMDSKLLANMQLPSADGLPGRSPATTTSGLRTADSSVVQQARQLLSAYGDQSSHVVIGTSVGTSTSSSSRAHGQASVPVHQSMLTSRAASFTLQSRQTQRSPLATGELHQMTSGGAILASGGSSGCNVVNTGMRVVSGRTQAAHLPGILSITRAASRRRSLDARHPPPAPPPRTYNRAQMPNGDFLLPETGSSAAGPGPEEAAMDA